MKKIFCLTVFFCLAFTSLSFAQQVQIIDLQGKVRVRDNAEAKWRHAEKGEVLAKNAEIKTGSKGKCVIAFDTGKKNTVTIERKSRIKIENIVPGEVFLPKGRVFTLIRNIDQVGDFKVKTPTAVAGARGTGWVTEFENGFTSVSVFEDNVFVAGFDSDGFIASEIDVREELQTVITSDGQHQDLEPVTEVAKQEWTNEVQVIEKFIQEHEKAVEKQEKEKRQATDPKGPPTGDPKDKPKKDGLGPEHGKMHQGPRPPDQHMQEMIARMRESGEYSEAAIQNVEQAMTGDVYDLSPEEMINVMQTMDGMNQLSPEMQAMMGEMVERQDELESMSPEEMEAAIHEMEDKYNIDQQGDATYQGDGTYQEYTNPTGEYTEHSEGDYTDDPNKDYSEPAGEGDDLAHDTNYSEPTGDYATGDANYTEPIHQDFDYVESDSTHLDPIQEQEVAPEFDAYIDSFNDGTEHNDPYNDYSNDQHFGEFDQTWDSTTGQHVNDDLHNLTVEQQNTILDDTRQGTLQCLCPDCHPDGNPQQNCP